MSLALADRPQLLAALNALLSPQLRAHLEAHEKLSPWVPDLEAHQRDLQSPEAPPPPKPVPIKPLDVNAEELLNCLRDTLRAAIRWRRARGEAEAAAQLEATLAALYPEGVSFLSRPVAIQAAVTQRLLETARQPDHATTLTQLNVCGATAAELLDAIESANNALLAAIAARAEAPLSTANGYAILRTQVISTLHQLRLLIERNTEGDTQTRLLAALPRG